MVSGVAGLLGDKVAQQIREALRSVRWNAKVVKHYFHGLTGREATRPFILFGLMRSGTTLCGDLLGQHPELTWFGEAFDNRVHCPVLYLRGVARGAPTHCAGLKIFPFQLSRRPYPLKDFDQNDIDRGRRILEALHSQSWKLIHLRREDIFAQCVSFIRASRTGVWHTSEAISTGINDRIRLDVSEFERYLNSLITFRRHEQCLLSEVEMLRFTYEADLRNPQRHQATADNAFRFLGLPTASVSSTLEIIDPRPFERQIENYDEVARLAQRFGVNPT
jgi:LPS sulfotransferase NodH